MCRLGVACDCSLSDNDVCTFVCMFPLDAILGHVLLYRKRTVAWLLRGRPGSISGRLAFLHL